MTNKILSLSIAIILLLSSSCSTTYRYKKQGFVSNKSYYVEIPFTYENSFIFIPVKIQGKSYNFLFDTGAELNLIDPTVASELNFKKLKKGSISNAKTLVKEIQRIRISKINIGGIEFNNTVSLIWDISKIGKYIRCKKIDGFIGNNLMRKAGWQIDYQNKIIRIADNIEKFDIPANSKKIKMGSGKVGNAYLNLEINKTKKYFTFDTGYHGFANTGDTTLLKNTSCITEIGLQGADFAGANKGKTHLLKFDNFKINDFTFNSPELFLVQPNRASILGNEFYENYVMTIDWKNNYLILEEKNKVKTPETDIYEVSFFTDYENGLITIVSIYEKSDLIDKIELGSKVLKINNIDLVKLKETGGICEFWYKEWKKIKNADTLNITIEHNGKQKDIKVKKIKMPI